MTAYLSTIKSLGFNAVWVNPFMKTSKYNMFLRQNKATGEKIRSVGSLYAMFDLSLIATEIYTETSTGDPSLPGSHDARPTLFMAKIAGDSTENLVLLAKKMAIAAFTSDADWYLLAGDEVLSDTIKSPYWK